LLGKVVAEAQTSEAFTIIDLGCGHGIFLALIAFALSEQNLPSPKLIGIDLADDKIALARRAFEKAELKADLEVRDIADFEPGAANAISILDVLYLVPLEAWDSIFQNCYTALKPNGVLILKEMNRDKEIKFQILCLEETLAVKVLRITKGNNFTFPRREEIRAKLESAGFKIEEEAALDQGYHVPHMLWMARKPTLTQDR
jgi:2-polyprenyl-3-methyl-5-hydroxy-6-metoxy-1,4-benzoquinol methylase